MVWDISIRHIDPNFIKEIMPHVTGFTSRLQDSTTRDFTVLGNMKLDRDLKEQAHSIRNNENKMRQVEKNIRLQARKNPRNMFENQE